VFVQCLCCPSGTPPRAHWRSRAACQRRAQGRLQNVWRVEKLFAIACGKVSQESIKEVSKQKLIHTGRELSSKRAMYLAAFAGQHLEQIPARNLQQSGLCLGTKDHGTRLFE